MIFRCDGINGFCDGIFCRYDWIFGTYEGIFLCCDGIINLVFFPSINIERNLALVMGFTLDYDGIASSCDGIFSCGANFSKTTRFLTCS